MTAITPGDGLFLLCVTLIALDQLQRMTNRQRHGAIMAAIDDLSAALDSISTEVDKIATETQELVTELQNANQNPAVDLTGVIAKAQAIQAKLQAVDDLVPDTTPVDPNAPTA